MSSTEVSKPSSDPVAPKVEESKAVAKAQENPKKDMPKKPVKEPKERRNNVIIVR